MKLKSTYLLVVLAFFGSKYLIAQQDPMYSMYIFDKMLINPAFSGSSNWAVTTAKYRQQYMGLNGHPVTQTINFHTPIQKKHLGFGLKIVNDKIAVTSNLNAAANVSYHLNFAKGKLSFGVEAGVYNRKIDYQKLVVLSPGDNALPTSSISSLVPDAAWGFYYQRKQMYMGFSQYHLIKSKFNTKTITPGLGHLATQMNFIVGKVYDLTKDISIEPSVLIKYQPVVRPQLDLNATVYYKDMVGVGLQYRTGDALVGFLKVNITENIRVAYAYDYTISKLSGYSKGAHEIIVSYGIKLAPPVMQKEIHPRYYF